MSIVIWTVISVETCREFLLSLNIRSLEVVGVFTKGTMGAAANEKYKDSSSPETCHIFIALYTAIILKPERRFTNYKQEQALPPPPTLALP